MKELAGNPDPWDETLSRLRLLESRISSDLQENEITTFSKQDLEDMWNFLDVFLNERS